MLSDLVSSWARSNLRLCQHLVIPFGTQHEAAGHSLRDIFSMRPKVCFPFSVGKVLQRPSCETQSGYPLVAARLVALNQARTTVSAEKSS